MLSCDVTNLGIVISPYIRWFWPNCYFLENYVVSERRSVANIFEQLPSQQPFIRCKLLSQL